MSSPLRRMVWVFPDRESTRTKTMWSFYFWDMYAEIATEMGMSWTRNTPTEITVDNFIRGKPRVFVNEDLVTPEDTLFITALYSLPYQAMDIFNQLSIYAVLEQLGFFLTFPSWVSLVGNDKLTSLLYFADSPVPTIPTIRIGTGPDVGKHLYEVAMESVTYPAIVKPAGWCGGGGLNLARNVDDVRGLASLAQGGDTTLVIQPYLGDGTIDYRVYVIGGEAYPYALTRTPEAGSPASNASRGGSMGFVPIPPELAQASAYFAQRLPIPFFCIDFLYDGKQFWFSELEPDGVIAPDFDDPQRTMQRKITRARWDACRDAHARWLTTSGR
jgi:glutathione synthase/RimK-type ligase-like ATP-grasp enzyme